MGFDGAVHLSAMQGITPAEIYERIVSVLTYEVPIAVGGDMRVSIQSLVLGLIVLLVALRLSKTARLVLQSRVLRKVPLDTGMVYALDRLVHYGVMTAGALFAFKVGLGVDYTGLVVVLTALSVGLGLGLREITSDVAAGFVLLFERPVRVGDRVRLDREIEGDVVSIGLRATRIVTNDRLTVIVPNSRLTNQDYVNWSYLNEPIRLHIPVGVAYGTDVQLVRTLLLAAVADVNRLVDEPRPDVRLVGFGDSCLDFEVLVWTNEPMAHPQIRSDVNLGIEREFGAAGVVIPFPQRDIHVMKMPAQA